MFYKNINNKYYIRYHNGKAVLYKNGRVLEEGDFEILFSKMKELQKGSNVKNQ